MATERSRVSAVHWTLNHLQQRRHRLKVAATSSTSWALATDRFLNHRYVKRSTKLPSPALHQRTNPGRCACRAYAVVGQPSRLVKLTDEDREGTMSWVPTFELVERCRSKMAKRTSRKVFYHSSHQFFKNIGISHFGLLAPFPPPHSVL